ncbi:MAG: response regulator [Chitinispirillales bacterium]|jgi:CheY-like chemotaxis protein|nr:response regulator [Chitinispirillales bacterium]
MRKNVLWVDDEIEFLRSHVAFLETRGYSVTPASSGEEALRLIHEGGCDVYDMVLLDKQMPIKSGSATLGEIKAICPDLPVVMLTGCQHGTDAACPEEYDGSLPKPIDPDRLLLACQRAIDSRRQRTSHKISDKYFRYYTDTHARLNSMLSASGWMDFYASLIKWDIEMEGADCEAMRQTHTGFKFDVGKCFGNFATENYVEWAKGSGNGRPLMSVDIIKKAVVPELRDGRSVLMVVLSGVRLNQFFAIEPEIKKNFSAKAARFMTVLPTTPDFCMTALASGLYPDEAAAVEPEAFETRARHDPAIMKRLMSAGLERVWTDAAKTFFTDANGAGAKRRIKAALDAMKKTPVFGIVALDPVDQFIDAESDGTQRELIREWFAGSEIFAMIKEACSDSCTVILTSDRGHVYCTSASEVYEMPKIDDAPRCIFGKRLSIDEREAFLLEEPRHFRLPQLADGIKCAMARENFYFTMPGKKQGPADHRSGGISLEEMVMPIYICRPIVVPL